MGLTSILNTAFGAKLRKDLSNFLLHDGVGPNGKTMDMVMAMPDNELMQDLYIGWLFPTDEASDSKLIPYVEKDSELVGYSRREAQKSLVRSYDRVLLCYHLTYNKEQGCIFYNADYDKSVESSGALRFLLTVQKSLIIFQLFKEEAALRGYAIATGNEKFIAETTEIAGQMYPKWNRQAEG